MRFGGLCAGIMCGAGLAARTVELGAAAPVVIGIGFASGGALALMLDAMDEYREHKYKKKKVAARRPLRGSAEPTFVSRRSRMRGQAGSNEEYLPPGIVRVNGRLTYACTMDGNRGYKRCGEDSVQKVHEPIRKICGTLSEDFSRLPENERREFFEGCF